MNRTYRRQQTAGKARQTAFLIATVFYALLTVGQLGGHCRGADGHRARPLAVHPVGLRRRWLLPGRRAGPGRR